MMDNNSPSFFDKLTGATRLNGAPQGEYHVSKDYRDTAAHVELNKKPPLVSREEEEEGQLTIDVYQTNTEIVIKSPVAGVKMQDLDVTITNDMVTIKGRRENEEKLPKENYFFQELYWGPFSRSVILPTEIEIDQAKAILKDGILTIRLPKVEKESAKKLSIEMG